MYYTYKGAQNFSFYAAKAADDGGTDTESDTKFESRGPRHPQAVSIQNHLVPGFGGGDTYVNMCP